MGKLGGQLSNPRNRPGGDHGKVGETGGVVQRSDRLHLAHIAVVEVKELLEGEKTQPQRSQIA